MSYHGDGRCRGIIKASKWDFRKVRCPKPDGFGERHDLCETHAADETRRANSGRKMRIVRIAKLIAAAVLYFEASHISPFTSPAGEYRIEGRTWRTPFQDDERPQKFVEWFPRRLRIGERVRLDAAPTKPRHAPAWIITRLEDVPK